MAQLRFLVWIFLLALTCSACAKTTAQGISGKNPDLAHLGPFDSTVVIVSKLPAEERLLVEEKLTKGLQAIGVLALPGSQFERVDPKEQEAMLREQLGSRAPDTLLIVQRDSAVERKRYMPPQWTSGYSYPMIVGDFTTWITVPPTLVPGYWIKEELGLYLAVLRHAKSGDTLWAAAVGSQGDDRAEWTNVTEEAAGELIKRLIGDGAFDPSAG